MQTFQHQYWEMQPHYVCTKTIISQEHVLTYHHKSFMRLLIFPELAHFIANLQKDS